MLSRVGRLLFGRRRRAERGGDLSSTDSGQSKQTESKEEDIALAPQLEVNAERIKEAFGNSSDLELRYLVVGQDRRTSVLVVFIDGMTDEDYLSRAMLVPLAETESVWSNALEAYQDMKGRLLAIGDVREVQALEQVLTAISAGDAALMVQGVARTLICGTRGMSERAIEEPSTEATIRGAKEGFVESLRTNTSLIRRRIRSPRLRIEEHVIGRISRTKVALAYIAGLADERLVQEARERLDRIDVDAVHGSGQIEEYVEDAPFSPFPTWMTTERPDRVTGALLEGRVAMVIDGTPFQLIAPATFTMFLSSSEDYFDRSYIGTFVRLLRFAAFFLSLTLSSLYVAVTTFHQEMLPTPLILNIAAQREGVPVPAALEAIIMELIFELMREAGVRLPRIIGPAISIIGALVLGDAAIRAGLVSPIMVVMVASTGIASFATPVFSFAISIRLLRFVFLLLAGSLGLFGVIVGLLAVLMHLASLRSLGVPYLEPLAPIVVADLKDALIRVPWWKMDTRPQLVGPGGSRRQSQGLKPRPPSENGEKEDRL